MTVMRIGPADHARHEPFCQFVSEVFPRADFRRWARWREWNEDYRAYAWIEHGRVLANASLTRMRLLLDGSEQQGWQFGAVGCVPDQRGRGLARRVMEAALAECGRDPLLLFANPKVLDFYPRFGFAPLAQWQFEAEHVAEPAGPPCPRLDVADPDVRLRLHALCAEGLPTSLRFGTRGHGRIASWYYANGFARPLLKLAEQAWIVAGIDGDTLHVDDIYCAAPFDLRTILPRLLDRPVARIRFGFAPERWWPGARAVALDDQAFLYVRGLAGLPDGPTRFPVLGRT